MAASSSFASDSSELPAAATFCRNFFCFLSSFAACFCFFRSARFSARDCLALSLLVASLLSPMFPDAQSSFSADGGLRGSSDSLMGAVEDIDFPCPFSSFSSSGFLSSAAVPVSLLLLSVLAVKVAVGATTGSMAEGSPASAASKASAASSTLSSAAARAA
eukprot:CAMPEP_0206471782 /NCGR_PEP_ID=MMETSP0324_2-20121206/31781_1 /ASSEMBLY_ACC=CAM_ASM_000836 /TAXON_ID=2866 /ORGANISM="Crypthecodinium cohnii, Strain Seligo" /LENGTH=160 /DNA_ID=CAMNT_0053946199 /DNA_START=37 /DNA_END=519 /DNA_ORIENTATION=+